MTVNAPTLLVVDDDSAVRTLLEALITMTTRSGC